MEKSIRLSVLEIFLLELVLWLACWLINDYLAALLTVILAAIVCCVWVFSLLSEWIERSNVPRKYFWVMGVSVAAPLVAALMYWLIFGGRLSFLE